MMLCRTLVHYTLEHVGQRRHFQIKEQLLPQFCVLEKPTTCLLSYVNGGQVAANEQAAFCDAYVAD
jgi:hypothetical protein